MKLKLVATNWIDNEWDGAILSVSYKMFEPFKKKFEELGFQITDEEPKLIQYPSFTFKNKEEA